LGEFYRNKLKNHTGKTPFKKGGISP
jgi:hypothetical protein